MTIFKFSVKKGRDSHKTYSKDQYEKKHKHHKHTIFQSEVIPYEDNPDVLYVMNRCHDNKVVNKMISDMETRKSPSALLLKKHKKIFGVILFSMSEVKSVEKNIHINGICTIRNDILGQMLKELDTYGESVGCDNIIMADDSLDEYGFVKKFQGYHVKQILGYQFSVKKRNTDIVISPDELLITKVAFPSSEYDKIEKELNNVFHICMKGYGDWMFMDPSIVKHKAGVLLLRHRTKLISFMAFTVFEDHCYIEFVCSDIVAYEDTFSIL